jgi:hypothetical protein
MAIEVDEKLEGKVEVEVNLGLELKLQKCRRCGGGR